MTSALLLSTLAGAISGLASHLLVMRRMNTPGRWLIEATYGDPPRTFTAAYFRSARMARLSFWVWTRTYRRMTFRILDQG